jgi:hypothetical protein
MDKWYVPVSVANPPDVGVPPGFDGALMEAAFGFALAFCVV